MLPIGGMVFDQRAKNGDVPSARWIGLVVQTQIRSGKTDDARRFLDDALVRLPDDRGLRHQSAALDALHGGSRRARLLQACGDWLGGRDAAHVQAVDAALQRLAPADLQRAAAELAAAEWRWLLSR